MNNNSASRPTMFNSANFNLALYKKILNRGLSEGLGVADGQMCIEAAVCAALGYAEHTDMPNCVHPDLQQLKIDINDVTLWSSPKMRAKGLKSLGLAQLGTAKYPKFAQEFRKLLNHQLRVKFVPVAMETLIPELHTSEDSDIKTLAQMIKSYKKYNILDIANYIAETCETFDKSWNHYETIMNFLYTIDGNDIANAINHIFATVPKSFRKQSVRKFNNFLMLACQIILDVLKKMKTPGVKLLKKL